MMTSPVEFRLIQPPDNPAVAQLIVTVLEEFGYTGPGIASADPELQNLYQAYQQLDSRYWVILNPQSQQIVGAGGFARLRGATLEEGICELQKLYVYPHARGGGSGSKLLELAIQEARTCGYREMYLETFPDLAQAVKLYEKYGFQHLTAHKGNTGHQARCTIFMSLVL